MITTLSFMIMMNEAEYKLGMFEPPSKKQKLAVIEDKRKEVTVSCRTCGCYGLRSEFYKPNYCVYSCFISSGNHDVKDAPIKLFKQPALPTFQPFRVGEQLEAIDPENQSLFCVVSISRIQGHRLLLHFEGYGKEYDFFVNADSQDIFPSGWAEKNGKRLEKSPVCGERELAKWSNFGHLEDPVIPNGVEVGMKLEAVDNNMNICVATVTQILGERFLVHFDSWDNIYDYWADVTSPFIHPVGYSKQVVPPNQYDDFRWSKYLEETNSVAMPSSLFQPLPPVGFRKGMRLQVVDQRNKTDIRLGRVVSIDQHMLTIRYDGWGEAYDVQLTELSGDIHPVGYCEHTGHPLTTTPTTKGPCGVMGCRGKGNIDRICATHSSIDQCPYNLNNIVERPERVIIIDKGKSMEVVGRSRWLAEARMAEVAQRVMGKVLFQGLVRGIQREQVQQWDSARVTEFLASIPGCAVAAKELTDIDGDALLQLTQQHLSKFALGVQLKILYIIQLIPL